MNIKHFILMTSTGIILAGCSTDKAPELAPLPVGDNPFFNKWDTPFNAPPFEAIAAEHYLPAFEAGMANQKENIARITGQKPAPTFVNTIEAMENSRELLTTVSTVFFNLTSANTTTELEDINRKISPVLSKHSDDIFMNAELFARVKTVFDNQAKFALNGEQTKLLEKTYRAFLRSGINLDGDHQARLRQINERLSALTVSFGQNLLAENNAFELVISNKSELGGLPQSSIDAAAMSAQSKGMEGKWRFTLHNPSAIPFMQYADSRSLREKIYKAYINKCDNGDARDNNAVAAEIAQLRAERAALLGYSNHAEYVLEETMAKKPAEVNAFLQKLWTPAIKVAIDEARQMQELMNGEGKGEKLEAWDWRYCAEKVRRHRYNLDAEALRPYFQLENVRDGIFELCKRLYGLTFEEVKNAPLYHPEAVAFEVKENGAHVGLLYMDFHPRESKRSGAWMTSYRKTSKRAGKRIAPIISIVCNFTRPSGEVPALLTADEVETFFHEFGHALHGLLGATQYSSLSGTSVPRDFVELPSQIMENWAFENEMLKLYARHYKTGEIIPNSLVSKMNEAAKFNQGFATVEYLAASILDMDYHTLTNQTVDTHDFEQGRMEAIGLIGQIAPRYRTTYFQHIFSGGYSAGYYSYIWAEVLDSDAFAKFKESGDIFNREIANSFRKNILENGGTKDAMEMYRAFRGAEPDVKHLLVKRGLN